MSVDIAYLKECLDYDPDTGLFRWKVKTNRNKVIGRISGSISRGYVIIGYLGKKYCAHRLAWAFFTGEWPELQIDHINGIRDDNRIINLREASHAENQQNRKSCTKNNKTKFMGVIKDKKSYRAQITINGKAKNIGNFITPEEAHAAYIDVKRKRHPGNTL